MALTSICSGVFFGNLASTDLSMHEGVTRLVDAVMNCSVFFELGHGASHVTLQHFGFHFS
jgi:hypothetical protein